MAAEDRHAHWQSSYAAEGEQKVSWFQESPQPSLDLVTQVASSPAAAIVDVGGDALRLAEELFKRGYQDITVLDLSETALAAARVRLGRGADRIRWIAGDATDWEPPQSYDVWHDRATFHFLVEEADRAAYLSRLTRFLNPSGHAIIATFAPDGPERCSGLPSFATICDSLGQTLGPAFVLLSTRRHVHTTPWGSTRHSSSASFVTHREVA